MSVLRDDCGDRWLICDCCRPDEEDRLHGTCINRFWGTGLDTAKLVRSVARDIEGWTRRKLIVGFKPLRTTWADLCPACKTPEVQMMRLIGAAAQAHERGGTIE